MERAAAYAELHRKFLEQEAPEKIKALKVSGEFLPYLKRVGQTAADLYDNLEVQMTKDLPTDYFERVKALEAIPHTVNEIILNDAVYNSTP